MTPRPLIAGNWKMNLRSDEIRSFAEHLARTPEVADPAVDVVLFPSAPYLSLLATCLEDTPVEVGAQDLHPEQSGAHTGDVSAPQLLDVGCVWALCGHSERRQDHGESDDLVARKYRAAGDAGLRPILCIGETAEEREAGLTSEVLSRQLGQALAGGDTSESIGVAYEPVWAIGSGRSATPEIAQEAHAFIRTEIQRLCGPEVGCRILYGGSVKASNCRDLLRQSEVDGFLIGGASLDPVEFADIIRRCVGLGPSAG